MKRFSLYVLLSAASFFATKSFAQIDSTPPAIGSPGANATILCPTTPSFTAPTASDAQGGVTVNLLSDVVKTRTCANSYTATRTWDAVDASGNHSITVSQTITVIDIKPPTIGSPGANVTISCPSTPSFTAPPALDACGPATVNVLRDSAVTFASGYTVTRTWDAVDACGNHSATRSQTITVLNNTPPAIGSPGANATIECSATPIFTAPTASDAQGGVTVNLLSEVRTAGTCANSYAVTRTWDAVDGCGSHSVMRSQTITVIDTRPPTIGPAGANATIEITATPIFTAPTASDACGPATVNLLSDIISDLRAGTIAGSYEESKTWDAVDACGNHSAAVSQTITVIDPGGIIQPDANIAGRSPTNEEIVSENVKVYPNPLHNKFRIDLFTKTAKKVQINLYDRSGHLLQRKEIYCTAGTSGTLWDMSSYVAGVYFIVIENMGVKGIMIVKQ